MDSNAPQRRGNPLTIPLWIIAICLSIQVGLEVFLWINPNHFRDQASQQLLENFGDQLESSSGLDFSFPAVDVVREYSDNFNSLSIEEQVKRASVVGVALIEIDDGKIEGVVSEIFKQAVGADLDTEVGERLPALQQPYNDQLTYGDAIVFFMTGTPPAFRRGISVFDGKLVLQDGLTLEDVRRIAIE
ncbi:MAG: hypothetical protein AAGL69_15025 [Pseudomonadota bacterium]